MSLFDACYRALFNHRLLLLDLLQSIFPTSLLNTLDLNSIQPLPTAYIGPAMQLRQGDLAWRIPAQNTGDPDLLLGIEHQSRPDRLMALRVGTYKHLQLESFLRQHAVPSSLPVPVMLVLYSGKATWRAPVRSRELFPPLQEPCLVDHIPQQAYWLIDLKKLSIEHSLQTESLFILICQIQHNQGLEHLNKLMQTVLEQHLDQSLLRDLASWINQAILPSHLPRQPFPHHTYLKDIQTMLEKHADSWTHQWEAQGFQKGSLKAQQTTLLRLLHHKFGKLPKSRRQQLMQAGSRQLSIWSLRVLDSLTLDDVFVAAPSKQSN